MERLWKAIKARYDSAAGATLRGLTPGGLWLHLAPHGVNKPYVVMLPVSALSTGTMSTTNVSGYIEDAVIQVGTFVDEYNIEAGYAIIEAWKDLFDNVNLTFASSSGHTLGVRRISSSNSIIREPDAGYQILVEYRYWFDEV